MARRLNPSPQRAKTKKTGTDAPKKILRDAGDIAAYWSVSLSVVNNQWLKYADFPGRPGHFPVNEINKWLVDRQSRQRQGPRSKAAAQAARELGIDLSPFVSEKERIALAHARLDLGRMQGHLINREMIHGEVLRTHAIAFQSMKGVVNLAMQCAPPDITNEKKREFDSQVSGIVDACIENFILEIGKI